MRLSGPLWLLALVSLAASQSIEQLLAQARAEESIENLLADAVVEEPKILTKIPARQIPQIPDPTTTTEAPRRRLFRPRASRPSFLNRVRTNLLTTTTTEKPVENQPKTNEDSSSAALRPRVSLFSSPRQRFRPRPRRPLNEVEKEDNTTTEQPTSGSRTNGLLRRNRPNNFRLRRPNTTVAPTTISSTTTTATTITTTTTTTTTTSTTTTPKAPIIEPIFVEEEELDNLFVIPTVPSQPTVLTQLVPKTKSLIPTQQNQITGPRRANNPRKLLKKTGLAAANFAAETPRRTFGQRRIRPTGQRARQRTFIEQIPIQTTEPFSSEPLEPVFAPTASPSTTTSRPVVLTPQKLPRKFAAVVKTQQINKSNRRKQRIGIVDRYSTQNEDGSFTWGYQSADGSFKEETIGIDCVTRGRYGYIDPRGEVREFSYKSGNPCNPDTKQPLQAEDRISKPKDKKGHFDWVDNRFVLPSGRRVKVVVNKANRARG